MDKGLRYFPFGHGVLGMKRIVVPMFKVEKCKPSSTPVNRP
jgi:hypothetical protein